MSIKKGFFTALLYTLSILSYAKPVQLNSYQELSNSLQQGYHVQAIIHENKCIVTEFQQYGKAPQHPNLPGDNVILGIPFHAGFFMIMQEENDPRYFVVSIATNSFSKSHNQIQTRYKSIKVYDDDTVEVYNYLSSNKKGILGATRMRCNITNPSHVNAGVRLVKYED
jgi:hypothetical protein